MSEARAGTLIDGRYRLERSVRTGGTSTRWLGYDQQLGQTVMLDDCFLMSGDDQGHFLARIACQLKIGAQLAGHPRLLGVRGTAGAQDRPWLVFEAEDGITLTELLDRSGRPLPVEQARLIASHVLEALAALHAVGFVHRDVKPTNIIVAADGSAQLTGCDIAWDATVGALEYQHMVIGTPEQMAPERLAGVSDDPRSDVFGLGVTLYQALTGVSPFRRDTAVATMLAVRSDDPAPLSDEPFSQLVMRMLAKEPTRRPTAEEALSLLGATVEWNKLTVIERRIQEAGRERSRYLDLSGQRAPVLPESIGSLVGLRHLSLAGMGLESLPPMIGSLHYLESLDLSGNHLRSWMKVATPTVFTVTDNRRRVPGTHRYVLRLYCAEPEAVHPLPDDRGCYHITDLQPWLGAVTRHLARITKLLAPAVGLTGKALGAGAPELLATAAEDLKKVNELLKQLPGTTDQAIDGDGAETVFDHAVTDADARTIENLLLHVDPARRWGGLSKTLTRSGLVLYLCEEHAAAYSAPSPRLLDI